MRLELDSDFPPNKVDTIFAYYEDGFFETTRFLPELSGNFKSRDHELTAQTMSLMVKPWELEGLWYLITHQYCHHR